MSLPHYDFDRLEALEELTKMPGYDASYVLAYYNAWSDFEDNGWVAIFERNGQFFQCDGGYSPMVGHVEEKLLYEPITLEQALEEIEAMEETCAEMDRKHSF
ncbi:hypothetical protein [Rhizobium sp. MHM7A]|uniref:hypothetical protein n=1 Tax=Rhizobium sp. MHM7A TaxID=2583233 RepID=UPI00110642B8|nr:hypothetical protein [Rhizobium sp. MHM7A]TLX16242.1 hypothetical protein FFR93_02625 [Rhizobium sp. MHM7A]